MEMEQPTQTPPILAGRLKKRKNENAHLAPRSDQDGAGMNLVQDSDANVDAWSLVAATYPDSRRFAWIGFRCESTIGGLLRCFRYNSSSCWSPLRSVEQPEWRRAEGHEGVWVLTLHLGWIVRLLKENSGPTKP